MVKTEQRRLATTFLAAAVWHGAPMPADETIMAAAVREAARNQVQGLLARSYPEQLSRLLSDVERATAQFHDNLVAAAARLRDVAVLPILIKAEPEGCYVYPNFDLVVGDQFDTAYEALAGWYVRTSRHRLEPDKVLLHPPSGPAAHLHRAVSWFGVPVVPAARLAARAVATPNGWLRPTPADDLRIWLAHAVFQNLAFDLSELLAIRAFLRSEVVADAEAEAEREGWRRAFSDALFTARHAVARLDDGDHVPLPVPLRASASIAVAREHVRHLLKTRQGAAAGREVILRGPLAMVKRCRLALA
jgi:hypothetical protein